MKTAIEKATRKQFPQGIPAFGTDALRFTFAALATMGRDIRFDLGRVEGYRNFCNKLWNASRYVLMNTEEHAADLQSGRCEYSVADRWIRGRLGATIDERARATSRRIVSTWPRRRCTSSSGTSSATGTWNCASPCCRAPTPRAAQKRGTRRTLLEVLEGTLRMLHPLMPFITEEIWQKVGPLAGRTGPTVMLQPYPTADEFAADAAAERQIAALQAVVLGVRQIRGELDVPHSRATPVYVRVAQAWRCRGADRACGDDRARSRTSNRSRSCSPRPTCRRAPSRSSTAARCSRRSPGSSTTCRPSWRGSRSAWRARGRNATSARPSSPTRTSSRMRRQSVVDAGARARRGIRTAARAAGRTDAAPARAHRTAWSSSMIVSASRSAHRPQPSRSALRAWSSARSPGSTRSSSARSTQIRLCLACLLARGHLLIEDIPGVGKTTLAHALARSLGLTYQRIQFTSDLLPADIIGVSVFEARNRPVPLSSRPGVLAARAGRRGQSRHAQGAERVARGDGRAPGHGGRPDLSADRAVLRDRDAEPGRTRSARFRCPSRSSTGS